MNGSSLKKRITAPNYIYTELLNEFKHTRIDDNDNIVDFHSGMGDIIQVPPYKAIKNYIENNVSSFQCLSINLNIKYLMQDASKSESTAISTLFPDAVILYCYFHLKDINKRNLKKYDLPHSFRKEILSYLGFNKT